MLNEGLPNALRTLVEQTVKSGQPADFVLGEVTAESPLTIRIDEKRELSEDFLLLSDNVRDFEVDIEVNHLTEEKSGGANAAAYESHAHAYRGRKKIKVYNALKAGEKVIMIRQQGGQMYYVADRVNLHSNVVGQWG